MFQRTCLALGLALSCFAAAAKAPALPTPLAQELPVELVLNQQEIAIDVPETASNMGAQFGLIGALIGGAIQNSQTKSAEERMVPLRNVLVEYRFNERMEAAVRAKLASEGLSPNPKLEVRPTVWDAAQANVQSTNLQALVLVPRYTMDYGLQRLSVTLSASFVERTPKPNGKFKSKVRVTRSYSFDFPMTQPAAKDEDLVQRWAAIGSVGLGQLLDQGIEQSVDMLVHDFSVAGRGEWKKTVKKPTTQIGAQTYPGLQIRQGEGWAWVRWANWMYALEGHRPLDAVAIAALTTPAAPVAPVATAVDAPVAPVAAAPAAQDVTAAPAAPSEPVAAPAAPADAVAAPAGSGG